MGRASPKRAKSARTPEPSRAEPRRVAGIDALRGIAIAAMVVYHFAFDLRLFGVIAADFENGAFWLTARALIVTSFLLLVGISLVLARRQPAASHYRRIAVIAGCAALASVASFVVDAGTYIYFGVLHCIALAALVGRPLATRPYAAAIVGIAIVIAGATFAHPFFDARATSWIGFNSVKPRTQDFVPLFPWAGVVLLGIALGNMLDQRAFTPVAAFARSPALLRAAGRHSLLVYMAHQPIIIGAMWIVLRSG